MESMLEFIERRKITMEPHYVGVTDRDGWRCFQWALNVKYEGRAEMMAYHCGMGHCKWVRGSIPSWDNGVPAGEKRGEGMRKQYPQWRVEQWLKAGALKPTAPNLSDVLDCVRLDCSGLECSPDFEDWAIENGYDCDSRKAEDVYRACRQQRDRFRALLGRDAFREFMACEMS